MDESAKMYELATIFDPEVEEGDLKNSISDVESIIANAGGKVVNQEIWGLRDFAYPIRKKSSGYYVFYHFAAPHEAPHKIRDTIRLREDILRHMIVVRENVPMPIEGGETDGAPQN